MERIAREIRRLLRQEEVLRVVSEALAGSGRLEDRLLAAAGSLRRIVPLSRFEIAFPGLEGGPEWVILRSPAGSSSSEEGPSRTLAPGPGGELAARALSLGTPVVLEAAENGGPGALGGGESGSLAVPLLRGGEALGLLTIHSVPGAAFEQGDVAVLQWTGELMALALAEERARRRLKAGREEAIRLAEATGAAAVSGDPLHYLHQFTAALAGALSLERTHLLEVCEEGGNLLLRERRGGGDEGPDRAVDVPLPGAAAEEIPSLFQGGVWIRAAGAPGDTPHGLLRQVGLGETAQDLAILPLRSGGPRRWLLVLAAGRGKLCGGLGRGLLGLARNQAEQALAGMALYQKLRRDLARLSGLLATARAIFEAPPNGDLFPLVMEKVRDLVECDGGTLYLADGGAPTPVPVFSTGGESPPSAEPGESGGERELVLEIMRGGRPHVREAEQAGGAGPAAGKGGRLLAVPLLRRGKTFGALCIRRSEGLPFSREDLTLLAILAGFTAEALAGSLQFKETRALRHRLEILENLAGEGLLVLDGQGRVTRANAEALRILGCAEAELLGGPVHPWLFRDPEEPRALLGELAGGGEARRLRTWARGASDDPLPVEIRACRRAGEVAEGEESLLLLRVATEQDRLEKALAEAGKTDSLTGLIGQTEASRLLEAELRRGRDEGCPPAVVLLRLRGLGDYNRLHGRTAGDLLLRLAGEIFRQGVRGRQDAACRVGGAEFLLVLPATPAEQARICLQRLREALEGCSSGETPVDFAVGQGRIADSAGTLLTRLFRELEGEEGAPAR
jgi:diguanylate cyclase (GGDEF)-like protein